MPQKSTQDRTKKVKRKDANKKRDKKLPQETHKNENKTKRKIEITIKTKPKTKTRTGRKKKQMNGDTGQKIATNKWTTQNHRAKIKT